MVKTADIYDAYFETRRNKRRSEDSVLYEMHFERNLIDLEEAISSKTVQPTAYTFIAPRPKPREVFACNLGLRVIHHYIDIRLRPLMEAELTDRTFNNRIGYGPDVAVNTLLSDIYDVTEGFTKEAWVVSADLAGYFPNANQDVVYEQLRDLAERGYDGDDKDDLLYLIQVSVFSYPTHHCYRKSPLHKWEDIPAEKSLFSKPDGIGGAIGYLNWQNAMNYYLNDFDKFVLEYCCPHYLRFVDDMRWVTDNKEALLAMFPLFRKMLAEKGCAMNEHKFSCQQATKGGVFIGKAYHARRVYPSRRIVRNCHQTIRRFNRCPREGRVQAFVSSMNSYFGIFKNCNGYNIIKDCLREICGDWFRFVHFDEHRLCLNANAGYTVGEMALRHLLKHNEYERLY